MKRTAEEKYLSENLPQMVPENMHIEVSPLYKNGVRKTGIRAWKTGTNVAPVVYWEDFRGDIEERSRIVLKVLMDAVDTAPESDEIIGKLTDREYILSNVFPLLSGGINTTADPFLEVGDLGLYLEVEIESPELAGVSKVNFAHLQAAGITRQEALEAAFRNVVPTIRTLKSAMASLAGTGEEENLFDEGTELTEKTAPMLIVTDQRRSGMGGAAAILIPEVQKRLHYLLGSTFYVLPSSIHEVICICTDIIDVETLREMVYEINRTQVAPEERLSDNVYICTADGIAVA